MKIYIDNIPVDLKRKVPAEWKHEDNARAFIHAYRVFGVKKDNLDSSLKEFLLGDTIVLLFHGTFLYSNPADKIYKIENSDMKFLNPELIKAQEDTYLFLITSNEDESSVYTMLGLLNAFLGKNITCEYIFDNFMFISEGSQGTVTSYPVTNYYKLPVPDISDTKFELIKSALSNISSKSGNQKRKIIFSLSWFFEANNSENDNRNVFMKNWIAIETLTMNSTRREPIGDLLGSIYSMNSTNALNYFKIQQVYKIRCKIVHEGKLVNLDLGILAYLQDLYVDLLFHIIGIESEFRAKNHIENGLDVLSYLQ